MSYKEDKRSFCDKINNFVPIKPEFKFKQNSIESSGEISVEKNYKKVPMKSSIERRYFEEISSGDENFLIKKKQSFRYYSK